MTDPTTRTVRGWLVELLQASGLTVLPDLLAELRYLNLRLWGSTAEAPAPVYTPLGDLLTQSLSVQSVDQSGNPATIYLLQYMLGQMGPLNGVRLQQHLSSYASHLAVIRASLFDEEGAQGVGVSAGYMTAQIQTLLQSTGFGTGAGSVQGLLAALQLLATQGNEYQENYGTAVSQAMALQLAELECICENTGLLIPPPEQPYPPVENACETSNTIVALITFTQWTLHTNGVWFCVSNDNPLEDGRSVFNPSNYPGMTSFDGDYACCLQARGATSQVGTFVLYNSYNPNYLETVVNSSSQGGVGNIVVVEGPPQQIVGYTVYWDAFGTPSNDPPEAVVYLEVWQDIG
jgi:hypothetical protein